MLLCFRQVLLRFNLLASSSAVPVLPMAIAIRARVHVSPSVPLTPFAAHAACSASVSLAPLSMTTLHPCALLLATLSCAPLFGCPLYTLVYCSLYTLIESSYCSSFKLSGVIFPARRSVKMRFLMIRAVGFASYFNVVLRVIFCNDW